MKTLVIYYSMEGNTEEIARSIARELGADLERIEPKDRIKAEKFMSYYWTGDDKAPEKIVEIEPMTRDVEDYDLIIIGTPVWAWAPAPPIHTMLTKTEISGKRIALFSTSEGDAGKTFEKMRKHLPGNRIISLKDFSISGPMDIGKARKMAASWAKNVKDHVNEGRSK
jgi:flavodoxin